MKKILNFKLFLERNDAEDYTNQLLDKISDMGIDSLTDDERSFLNSHKYGNQEEELNRIKNEFSDTIHGIDVKFIYKGSKPAESPFFHHYGTLIIDTGDREYKFDGSMSEYYGTFVSDFQNDETSDWDIFEGLEHEYEQFLELIFGELEEDYRLI